LSFLQQLRLGSLKLQHFLGAQQAGAAGAQHA
jgi:hypothetical protein